MFRWERRKKKGKRSTRKEERNEDLMWIARERHCICSEEIKERGKKKKTERRERENKERVMREEKEERRELTRFDNVGETGKYGKRKRGRERG